MRYILGLGNYAMGDDGIGLRIIESIAEQGLDEDFEAIEIANNGMQVLTYFEEQTELLVIVDAVSSGGENFSIISTSQGVLSDRVCRERMIGGELLCTVH